MNLPNQIHNDDQILEIQNPEHTSPQNVLAVAAEQASFQQSQIGESRPNYESERDRDIIVGLQSRGENSQGQNNEGGESEDEQEDQLSKRIKEIRSKMTTEDKQGIRKSRGLNMMFSQHFNDEKKKTPKPKSK